MDHNLPGNEKRNEVTMSILISSKERSKAKENLSRWESYFILTRQGPQWNWLSSSRILKLIIQHLSLLPGNMDSNANNNVRC